MSDYDAVNPIYHKERAIPSFTLDMPYGRLLNECHYIKQSTPYSHSP